MSKKLQFETDDVPEELLPEPIGWKILVSPILVKKESAGGILLVEETQKNEEFLRSVGKVVKMGVDAYQHPKFNLGLPLSERVPKPWVNVGDIIFYNAYDGMNVKIVYDNREVSMKVINDDAVITRINNESVLTV